MILTPCRVIIQRTQIPVLFSPSLTVEGFHDLLEALDSRLQVLNDFCGQLIRIREIVKVLLFNINIVDLPHQPFSLNKGNDDFLVMQNIFK